MVEVDGTAARDIIVSKDALQRDCERVVVTIERLMEESDCRLQMVMSDPDARVYFGSRLIGCRCT